MTAHTTRSFRQAAVHAAAVVLGAAFLLLPAFLNAYPIVNSDDGTYLQSGFLPAMPGDRPIAYGLFLRAASLNGVTLWLPCIAQALAVSWLVQLVARRTAGTTHVAGAVITVLLAVLTPLGTVASQLIPDVCTPIALLSLAVLLMGKESRGNTILLWGMYILSVACHISHVMIFGVLLGGLLCVRRGAVPLGARRKATIALLVTTGLIITMLKPLGASSHAFTTAALLDQGILKPYLDEACPSADYTLCQYKDSLGNDPNLFLWDTQSPMQREGGWRATRTEYRRMLRDIHSSPKWLQVRAVASARQTVRQLAAFGVGDGMQQYGEGSHIDSAIRQYVPGDLDGLLTAVQQRTEIGLQERLKVLNPFFYAVTILAAATLLAVAMLRWRRLPKNLSFFTVLSLMAVLLNAWNCGTFSNVLGRYGCRMIWLIPFCVVLASRALCTSRPSHPS